MSLTIQLSIMIWFVMGLMIGNMHFVNTKMSPKVVRGERADIKRHGYSAYLSAHDMTHDARLLCGGSILNQNIILTAAHCLEDTNNTSKVVVMIGHSNHSNGKEYRMKAIKVHEDYNPYTVWNDIALVLLTQDIQFGKTMYRIELSTETPRQNVMAKIAGWGRINEAPVIKSPNLFFTTQRIWPQEYYRSIVPNAPPKTFCAGELYATSYPSHGDSGGALVVDDYLQVGILSFTLHSLKGAHIYTDVSQFHTWIETNVINLTCTYSNHL